MTKSQYRARDFFPAVALTANYMVTNPSLLNGTRTQIPWHVGCWRYGTNFNMELGRRNV